MNPNKALWEKGDFTQIAETMRESGSALIEKLGINKGMQVLDLGCGDGTTALPAAKLGAEVLGGEAHCEDPLVADAPPFCRVRVRGDPAGKAELIG